MMGGFGTVGQPTALVDHIADMGIKNLTIIANNAGAAFGGMTKLLEAGAIRKVVCSYPRSSNSTLFIDLYRDGKIELDLTPQGTLAERIRAASAGIPAFFTPTAAGTQLGAGKETREINGRLCVLETALFADIALIEAWEADRWGNLTYKLSGRNFNPIMAGAAKLTIVQTQHKRELGEIAPDAIMTPGIFVNRVVHVPYGDPTL
jgi:3-oxoadipate CoA-transferase alpha subunit